MVGRIPILHVMPVVDLGRQAAKATVGEPMPVSATVFREGHDKLGAEVVATDPAGTRRAPGAAAKHPERPDYYEATVTPDVEGPWTFEVQAWSDPIGTWQHAAGLKIPAGVDVELMFTEGRLLFERVRDGADRRRRPARSSRRADRRGRGHRAAGRGRLAALQSPELTRLLAAHPIRELVTIEGPYPMYADRQRALFGSWYEFFPRSEGATDRPRDAARSPAAPSAPRSSGSTTPPTSASTSSTCRRSTRSARSTARARTTPSRPDPTTPARRGRSARRTAGTTPSTPTWAPSRTSTPSSRTPDELGLEVALDLALQCAPDHPWVATHPEWFTTRADGTIAYAENPPKKYQDIYPVNFDNDPDRHLPRGAAHRQAVDVPRRADLPRRQPAHQAGRVLGVAAARGRAGPTPTCCSWPRRSPARR